MSGYLLETQRFRVPVGVLKRSAPLDLAFAGAEAAAVFVPGAGLSGKVARGLAGIGPSSGHVLLRGRPRARADKLWRRSVAYLGPAPLPWNGRVGNLIDFLDAQHARLRRETAVASIRQIGLGRGLAWAALAPEEKAAAELLLVAARTPDLLILDRFLGRLRPHPFADLILSGIVDHFLRFEKTLLIVDNDGAACGDLIEPESATILTPDGAVEVAGRPAELAVPYLVVTASLKSRRLPTFPGGDVLSAAAHGSRLRLLVRRGRGRSDWREQLESAGATIESETAATFEQVVDALLRKGGVRRG